MKKVTSALTAGPGRKLCLIFLLTSFAAARAPDAFGQETVRVDVEIEGIQGDLLANAEAVLSIKRQEGKQLSPSRARTLILRAPGELRTALEPFGFYHVEVDDRSREGGSEWEALYRVTPGPPTLVERLDLELSGEGATDSGFVALARSFPLVVGDTLLHSPYETFKANLQRYATNYGYFDAKFDTAQIRVDRERNTAEILLHFDTGRRYRFGTITVEQDVLDPEYVDGYVSARRGDPFDATLLRAAQMDMTTGPWFRRADVTVERKAVNDSLEIPVRFVLIPSRPQRYEVGVGYGTDTGFRGSVRARYRRLNRKAHNAEAELRVSQIETNIGARYSIPRPFPSTAVYSLFGSYGDVSPTWSTTKLGTLGVGWTHIRGPLQETVSLAWEESSFEAASQQGNATLVVPQVEGSWVRADDRIVTGRGQRVALTVNGAWDALLSTSTFLSTTLDAKMIRSAGRIRGIVRGTVAYLFTDSLTALPPTRRFVTGGDQSVRGYAYESLGPRNADGELIGGEALLVGSLEADYEVLPSWRVALFGDAGNALRSFSTLEVEVGVGAGIRWVSPIGMVRVDGAFAVTETGTPFRLHLVLGPDL